ncbi:UNVERIFIED_CONTAM: hypothetical protein GTU68_016772, partial [Idotea baltica]|nr:hypothetical protein [Idotea baltica]
LVILGGKESGVGAATLAKLNGYEVFVSDSGDLAPNFTQELDDLSVEWEQGKHSEGKILRANLVVKSPGIPTTAKIIQLIKQANIELISEIEFAYRFKSKTSKVLAITGSNGKTTTTLWSNYILTNAGYNVAMCGNIGYSFSRAVAEKSSAYYVVEVSSFQLDDIVDFCPDISVILNITPDHLDRYNYEFSNYVAAKFKIIENQNEEHTLIYNADDSTLVEYLDNSPIKVKKYGFTTAKLINNAVAYTANDSIVFNTNENKLTMIIKDLGIAGLHNVQNGMAAGTAARLFEVDDETLINSLSTFANAEHRMERVRTYKGITFVNDSKATNINSVWYALESIEGKIIWLVGGVDKGNDYEVLKPLVTQKVDAIICIGKDNQKIKDSFRGLVEHIVEITDMKDAVKHGFDISSQGDTILLSPACASFDFYRSYEDRGIQFCRAAVTINK